jgi:hypothetical protein
MAATIYVLCTATALLCAILLLRGYRRSRVRLLLWSGVCFALLAADNLFLFLDRIIFTQVDLTNWRSPLGLVAVAFLLYGLVEKDNK